MGTGGVAIGRGRISRTNGQQTPRGSCMLAGCPGWETPVDVWHLDLSSLSKCPSLSTPLCGRCPLAHVWPALDSYLNYHLSSPVSITEHCMCICSWGFLSLPSLPRSGSLSQNDVWRLLFIPHFIPFIRQIQLVSHLTSNITLLRTLP